MKLLDRLGAPKLHPVPEDSLTRQELARTLRVSVRTVDRWIRMGCPSEKWGRATRRLVLSEVRGWLKEGGYG